METTVNTSWLQQKSENSLRNNNEQIASNTNVPALQVSNEFFVLTQYVQAVVLNSCEDALRQSWVERECCHVASQFGQLKQINVNGNEDLTHALFWVTSTLTAYLAHTQP